MEPKRISVIDPYQDVSMLFHKGMLNRILDICIATPWDYYHFKTKTNMVFIGAIGMYAMGELSVMRVLVAGSCIVGVLIVHDITDNSLWCLVVVTTAVHTCTLLIL